MADKLEIQGMDVQTMTAVVRKLANVGGNKIGLKYLPFFNSPTEELTWDIVKAVSPIASFRAVDGESELVGKQAYDRAYADVVSISRKERFNASDLRKIKEAGMLPVIDGVRSQASMQGEAAKRKIRASVEQMKNAIDNRVEWMAINALLGKISYTGAIKFSVDYGVKGTLVPTNLWSDTTNATPLADIQGWQQTQLEETGIMFDTVIMSRKALNYIKDNAKLATVMQYTNPMQSIDAAKTLIQDNAGITIELYDATYTDESGGTITRFLDDDYIIMLPSKNILPDGVGDMATVAHPLANYTYGYYTWQETKNDPYGLEVGVGLDAFPRIIHPEALLNAKIS